MADARQSFAFDVSAPVQGDARQGGGYRASNVQGGQVSGANRSAEVAGAAQYSAGLGDYFDNLMKPALEREARARFVKGMTDQMYAEAGEEIRAGDGILTKIFGPSKYEEGAAFFESQERVQSAVQTWAGREDELKRMTQDEVTREWAKTMEETATGDPFTDDLISQQMIKQAAPMLQSVAKASYKFRQEDLSGKSRKLAVMSAETFQAQAQQFFATSDPNDPEAAKGFEVGMQNFLGGMVPLAGQDEDSYRASLSTSFRTMVRNGYGHAATALMQRGVLDMLPDDEREAAENEYRRFASKAVGNTAAQFMGDIDQLQGELEFGKLTGEQAVARMRHINEKIKRYSGV